MASIRLERLRKVYPRGHVAVAGLDLEVRDGELLVIVGPSGCGKSTVLRLVAGLELPTAGRVEIGNVDVTALPPRDRDVAMVFQSYALYPHKSVRENLAFGLRVRRVEASERARRIEAVAERLGLSELLERRPAQLSGGERQRVALGRALVREPQAFLLDEPLSNLDAKLRVEMRAELARLHRSLGATIVHVTHDQEEALTLGDRIAVLRDGHLEQVGPPLEIYRRPASVFTADFIGSPTMNWFPGRMTREAGRCWVRCNHFAVEAPAELPDAADAEVLLGVRPHDVELAEPGATSVRARVEVVQTLGSSRCIHARLERGGGESERITLIDGGDSPLEPSKAIAIHIPARQIHLFDPTTGRRLGPS